MDRRRFIQLTGAAIAAAVVAPEALAAPDPKAAAAQKIFGHAKLPLSSFEMNRIIREEFARAWAEQIDRMALEGARHARGRSPVELPPVELRARRIVTYLPGPG